MYTIFAYDVVNGEKTTKRILKPQEARSIQEIDELQAKIQKRVQRLHSEHVDVFVHYKCLIKDHIPYKK